MKEISLSKEDASKWFVNSCGEYQKTKEEYVAIVDKDKYDTLMHYRWWIVNGPNTNYAVTRIPGSRKVVPMHYFVKGCPIKPLMIDHIDHNGLHNTDKNIVIVTRRQNAQNKSIATKGKLPGVVYHDKFQNKYESSIQTNLKRISLGCYSTLEEAFFVYKKAVEDLGEFIQPYVLEKCYKIIDSEMVHI